MATTSPDVLVIGAGPTALTAATILRDHDVEVRVVGKGAGPIEQSRALVVQARTLELWHKLGLAGGAIEDGHRVNGAVGLQDGRALNGGRPIFDFSEIGAGQTPYPYFLVHEQSQTEPMLLDRLARAGSTVEWGTEATGLRQHPDHVEVTLRRGDGTTETVTPRWVIGADGASSTVRHALGLGFDGDTYETAFFLADVAMDWKYGHDQLYLCQTRRGTFLFVPMPDRPTTERPTTDRATTDHATTEGPAPGAAHRFRVLASIAPEDEGKQHIDIGDVQRALDERSGITATISDPRWVSLYRLHHRMAEHFRLGQVFLAGDAAHIHSPIGGQGMNTGIQDAYNLAWKLALVIREQARPALLDTYEAERRPVAQALLGTTDGTFRVLVSDKLSVRIARKVGAILAPRALGVLPRLRRRLFATVSQIAITYTGSGPAAPPDPDGVRPQAGDRAPYAHLARPAPGARDVFDLMTGPGHHLLILSGPPGPDPVLAGIDELLGEFAVPVTTRVVDHAETAVQQAYAGPGLVLVRPDGYLDWRGDLTGLAGLRAHLTRWYQPTGVTA